MAIVPKMRILVINSGSSSIKFRLTDVLEHDGTLATGPARLEGAVKGIGNQPSNLVN